METKFTKGNWEIGESGLSVICDNDYICTCHHEAEQWITEEQAKSNAKLIAAAPNLIETIDEMIKLWERVHSGTLLGKPTLNKAKQAIKKATE